MGEALERVISGYQREIDRLREVQRSGIEDSHKLHEAHSVIMDAGWCFNIGCAGLMYARQHPESAVVPGAAG
ncbi:MAG: hypothetical protein ACYCP0_04380 [Acidiferrobacteraceae bacterium]